MNGREGIKRTRTGIVKRIFFTSFSLLGMLLITANASAQNLFSKLVDTSKAEMAKKSGKLKMAWRGG